MKKHIALAITLLFVAFSALGDTKKGKEYTDDSGRPTRERRFIRRGDAFCRCCYDCEDDDDECRDYCCPCNGRPGLVKGVFYGLGDTVGNILP